MLVSWLVNRQHLVGCMIMLLKVEVVGPSRQLVGPHPPSP